MSRSLKPLLNELSGSSGETASQAARRATAEAVSPQPARHDPEVVAIARRRMLSGSEKRRRLAAAERCRQAGALGALPRREGIYSSMISSWRNKVGAAERAALALIKRGPRPDGSARQIQEPERANARLRHKLERAELIIDAQKNFALHWICRRRTTAVGTRDARHGRGRAIREFRRGQHRRDCIFCVRGAGNKQCQAGPAQGWTRLARRDDGRPAAAGAIS